MYEEYGLYGGHSLWDLWESVLHLLRYQPNYLDWFLQISYNVSKLLYVQQFILFYLHNNQVETPWGKPDAFK